MIAANKKFKEVVGGISRGEESLAESLLDLLAGGFVIDDGCAFLAALKTRGGNSRLDSFPDRTGYECFINSIHIDDYVASDFVLQACLFVETLFESWRGAEGTGCRKLQAIISCDEFGAVVKFCLVRDGESWLSDNLEEYEEGILVADSLERQLLTGGLEFLGIERGK